ncbi:MAG: carboxymuconolactone decarboxylase family protein [Alphaproteobacteria bacterium]
MPRIAPRKLEDVPELADFAKRAREIGRDVPNFVLTLAHRPDIARAWVEFRATLVGSGIVSEELKTFIAQVTSMSAGCNYCAAHNAYFGDDIGVDPARQAALWDYETSDLFDESERAVLRIAQGAAQVPNMVTDSDFEILKRHYDDAEIVEITATIAMFGFLNRFNETMATELESSPIASANKHLRDQGWEVGKHAPSQ